MRRLLIYDTDHDGILRDLSVLLDALAAVRPGLTDGSWICDCWAGSGTWTHALERPLEGVDSFEITTGELLAGLRSDGHIQVEWARLAKIDAELWVGVFDADFLWLVSGHEGLLDAVAAKFERVEFESGDHRELAE